MAFIEPEHLSARAEAENAGAEAEALSKATLALAQNLPMDAALDAVLRALFGIVPYEMASVLLMEETNRLFVARESPSPASNRPVTIIEANDNLLLQRVLFGKKSMSLPETREEPEWSGKKPFAGIRSWIAVPLATSESAFGLLSIGSKRPYAFATRHFRLAKLLAIPAAAAIQNARLYEWARIYANERETLLRKAGETSDAFESGLSSISSKRMPY
jgi:GAF domain-containing protein